MAKYYQGLNQLTHQEYYQGSDFGNYQFISLEHIINQFLVSYVGEGKIISKIKRTDVSFFAQRALAELSFDTFKSCKSQEILVPNTLSMILPHDYIDYTKVSRVDSAGIKHILYPTNLTSNPIDINQDSNGNYTFAADHPLIENADFSDDIVPPWYMNGPQGNAVAGSDDDILKSANRLQFVMYSDQGFGELFTNIYTVWQKIDVSNTDFVSISAEGQTDYADAANKEVGGTLWFGLSPDLPDSNTTWPDASGVTSGNKNPNWLQTESGNDAYLEWLPSSDESVKSLVEEDVVNVSAYNKVYVVITSWAEFSDTVANGATGKIQTYIDDIEVLNVESPGALQTNATSTSTAWDNYKSTTPSENNGDDYEDDTYWPWRGERYGLEPSHAQVNGSFYVDCRRGKINFSSNMSGKTVILDYISDHLGTEEEMRVHKFAEEAMYKWIAYSILSTSMNTPEYLVQRFKKEKFAETRKAKLRLSNINLEEITQILRGKSKQIKH